MSLRQLAGPFPITEGELGYIATSVTKFFWHPQIGIVAETAYTGQPDVGGRCTISLDGYSYETGGNAGGVPSSWGWWEKARRMVALFLEPYPSISEWAYDSRALIRQLITGGAVGGIPGNYVKLEDRYVSYFTGIKERNANGVVIRESGPVTTVVYADVGPGRQEGEVFVGENFVVGPGPPNCFFWDVAKQELSSQVMRLSSTPALGIIYAPEHGVIISLQSNGGLREIVIWSLEVKPFDVTDPVVVEGIVQAGRVVTYRTQVLGDQGEYCIDQLVNWTITGAGTLLTPQSKTDSNGYATVQVSYGIGEGSLVSTLKASVKC